MLHLDLGATYTIHFVSLSSNPLEQQIAYKTKTESRSPYMKPDTVPTDCSTFDPKKVSILSMMNFLPAQGHKSTTKGDGER